MPLAVQQMDLPIGATGLDTGTDERRLPAPKLAVLENARIVRGGKLQKRRGLRYVVAQSTTTGLFRSGNGVYALTSGSSPTVKSMLTNSPGADVCSWYSGKVSTLQLPIPLTLTTASLARYATVYSNGYWVSVSAVLGETSGLDTYTVVTDSSGREVFRDKYTSSNSGCNVLQAAVLTAANKVMLVYKDNASNLLSRSIDTGSFSVGAWTSSGIAPTIGGAHLVADPINTQFLLAFTEGANVRVARFSSAAAYVAVATVHTPAAAPVAPIALAVHHSTDHAFVATSNGGTTVYTCCFTPSTLAAIATSSFTFPAGLAASFSAVSSATTTFLLAVSRTTDRKTAVYTVVKTTSVETFQGDVRGHEMTSMVRIADDQILGIGASPDPLYSAPVVREISPLSPQTPYLCLGFLPLLTNYIGANPVNTAFDIRGFLQVSNNVVRIALPVATALEATTTTPFADVAKATGAKLLTFTFDRPTASACTVAPIPAGVVIGDRGTPVVFDGAAVLPLSTPPVPSLNSFQSNAGGSVTAANGNLFTIAVRHRFTAANGDVMFSPPSGPLTITWASGATSNGSFGTGSNTQLAANATVGATKTQYELMLQSSTANGTVLYEALATEAQPPSFPLIGVQLQRLVSDAVQVLRPTVSTGLTHTAPPPFRHIAATSERILGLSVDGTRLYTSLLREPGFGPAFAEETLIELATIGQEATAVAVLDSTILVFTRDSIFAITGDGPDNNGQGAWNPPQLLVRGYGTTEPQSVINTPSGVWFRGATGWRMLGRDLQLTRGPDGSFLGEEADSFLSSTVYQAVTVPQQGEVRWTLGATGILVYNYEYNVWSLWTSSATWQATCAAVDPEGRMWVLDAATGNILRESLTSYLDNNDNIVDTFVPMRVKTGKINVAGIKGFQRLRRVAIEHDALSAHGMTVKLYIDGETSPSTSRSWTESEITALPAAQKNLQVHVASQKGSYYELEIADTAPAVLGTGEGYHIVGAQVEIGVKLGNAKQLPAGNKR